MYDAGGKQLAEYSTIVATGTAAKVNYLTNDHLGSPRINTDATGTVTARHDYHPFGEEIATSQRTPGLGYQSDTVRKQFTGYERDGETDLDFAQARYYASSKGRFFSPDDFINDTDPLRPQSWNLYAYVQNCPLKLVDPTGEKAKVTVTRDTKSKTGTIVIDASFVVYGADGQGVTEDQLNEQKDLLRAQIVAAYSGTQKGDDGFTYTISANITVEVKSSEKEAIKSGADNLVEVGTKDPFDKNSNGPGYGISFHVSGEKFDRLNVGITGNNLPFIKKHSVYAHEFSHLLGNHGHPPGTAVSFPDQTGPGSPINQADFKVLFAPQVKQRIRETVRQAELSKRRMITWIPYRP